MTNQHVRQFHASMNDHNPTHEYVLTEQGRGVDTYVVELERHNTLDRDSTLATLSVWQKPSNNPRSERWTHVVRLSGEYSEMKSISDSLNSPSDVRELIDSERDTLPSYRK